MAPKNPKTKWLVLAIASGACAAFNGVFAKLTTTELTASWASSIAKAFALSPSNKVVELLIRAAFFALNLLFNAVMWGLFTRALTLASSTVRVSIINTSANFMVTAVLGAIIFSETLPGLWWLGAAFLVAGSVIIGRREEESKVGIESEDGADSLMSHDSVDAGHFRDDADAGPDDGVELRSVRDHEVNKSREDEDSDVDGVLR